MKYQVTCTDGKDYILEYKDFRSDEVGQLVRYINKKCTELETIVIKIRKWDD